MGLDITSDLLNPMVAAGQGLGGTLWTDMQTFAVPEFNKIAIQIVGIQTDMLQVPPPYTQAAAAALLDMQVRASIGVIVAMTSLTMLAVQEAIQQVMDVIRDVVNTAVKFPLIP
jgi:hypothetical protein